LCGRKTAGVWNTIDVQNSPSATITQKYAVIYHRESPVISSFNANNQQSECHEASAKWSSELTTPIRVRPKQLLSVLPVGGGFLARYRARNRPGVSQQCQAQERDF
jgi:hypothetical protein